MSKVPPHLHLHSVHCACCATRAHVILSDSCPVHRRRRVRPSRRKTINADPGIHSRLATALGLTYSGISNFTRNPIKLYVTYGVCEPWTRGNRPRLRIFGTFRHAGDAKLHGQIPVRSLRCLLIETRPPVFPVSAPRATESRRCRMLSRLQWQFAIRGS